MDGLYIAGSALILIYLALDHGADLADAAKSDAEAARARR